MLFYHKNHQLQLQPQFHQNTTSKYSIQEWVGSQRNYYIQYTARKNSIKYFKTNYNQFPYILRQQRYKVQQFYSSNLSIYYYYKIKSNPTFFYIFLLQYQIQPSSYIFESSTFITISYPQNCTNPLCFLNYVIFIYKKMHQSNQNIMKTIPTMFQLNFKQKTNWQQLLNTQSQYLCSYQVPTISIAIRIQVKLDHNSEFVVKYTTKISIRVENNEQILEYLNKMNSKPNEQNFKYYMLKQSKEIQAKGLPNFKYINLDQNKYPFKDVLDFMVESLSQYESFIVDLVNLNNTQKIVTAQEGKRSSKSNNYLVKLKNYITERIQKYKQNNFTEFKIEEITDIDSKNQSILYDHIFVTSLKDRIKQLFQDSEEPKYVNKIMRKIKIIETHASEPGKSQQWKPRPHAFGTVTKFYAIYEISTGSIHKQTNLLIQQDEAFIKTEGYLVQKKAFGDVRSIYSFETQAGILMHLRDKCCEYIGEYFAEQFKNNKINKLFSHYYPGQFSKQSFQQMKGSKKLRTISNLLIGIGFLSYCNIIHRDIKPMNVMLDKRGSPRIIDFGSARPKTPMNVKYRLNYELRTTLRYNIIYDQIPDEIKNQISKEKFQSHQNFDMYAFGKVLQECFMSQDLQLEIGAYIYEHISWLKDRCLEKNPNWRVSPQQAAVYLRLLLKKYLQSFK